MSESTQTEDADEKECRRWEMPTIDGSPGAGFLTAAALEQIQKQAWDEAYKAGFEKGLENGQKEVNQRADRFDELLIALSRPFDLLDESVEKQLVELSMMVVKQLFRRELKADPTHVIGVVRDAIKVLPISSRSVLVHLHPEDAVLVSDALSPTAGERAWSIVEDPLLQRGGCKITSENSQIDAQAETRLNAVIAAITGNERQR